MGCGCGKSTNVINRVARPSTDCMRMREELLALDLKAIRLQKDKNGDRMLLAETSGKIRGWISDLNYRCPDEYELNTIKTFIENEYSIYYP